MILRPSGPYFQLIGLAFINGIGYMDAKEDTVHNGLHLSENYFLDDQGNSQDLEWQHLTIV